MAIPVALIVAITVADVLSPENVHLGPLLVVAPALTASFGSSRLTALVGALAVTALVAISVVRNSVLTLNHETQIAALLIVSAFTVLFCRLRERHLAELAQVRSVAEAAQRVLLRPLPERIGDVRIASAYRAATDQARIGGDLYAALRTGHGTRLLIGDVRGKGLPAIEEAALVLGAFRSAAHREPSLPELRTELEETVCWNLLQPPADSTAADESFITAVLVDIPDDGSGIEVLNCGHPAPLLVHAGQVTALAPRQYATPIGMCLPQAPNGDVDAFPFAPGDTLVLYTDGVSEARDHTGHFYPLADRLAAWTDTESPEELLTHVRGDLNGFCKGTFDDDAAIVVLRREAVSGDERPPGHTARQQTRSGVSPG
ncbi:PP2C family protein-serine/threonine phosphatase [Streptomyces sp. CA-249302]|uniref:PP2C family protein-serine/threonine phosphatase n=1 Tax=Streptomyces sp. CA-249302 TaxID=3240058 RepID=UPI003D9034E0